MNKMWSNNLKDLLSKLFTKQPIERLGYAGKIKQHPWFGMMDWDKLIKKEIKPLFVPVIHCESDVSHFDKEFTTCSIQSHTSSFGDGKLFEGFSYENKINSPEATKMEAELNKSDEENEIVFTLQGNM